VKRSFSTLCCLNDTVQQVISYALENDMKGVELRVSAESSTFDDKTIADAEEIRNAFQKAGLEITDLALSCSVKSYDQTQIEIGKAGIDFAAALNARAVRLFIGEHQERFSDKIESDLEGIVKALGELADYAKKKGVEIWLETHSCFSTGKSIRELLDLINRDNAKAIWDLIHTVEYRETPKETVKYLGDKIAHIHLKDGRPNEDRDIIRYLHTDLGAGTMPLGEMLTELKSIGFDGFFSLEWESPWRAEIRDLYPDTNDLLKKYNEFLRAEIS